jgi:hypothetical protein
MSRGVRDMLANRRFAVPLIVLLAFCLIGLILIGVVLIWQPGAPDDSGAVAQGTATAPPEPTALSTLTPTATATPRPSPTLVPVGTQPAATPETTAPTAQAEETQDVAEQTMTAVAADTAAAEGGNGEDATPPPRKAANWLRQVSVGD